MAVEAFEPKLLPRSTLEHSAAAPGRGLQRIFHAVTTAPTGPFLVHLNIPQIGELDLASASLHERATVIAMTFRPDGSIETSQNLLRLPGREYPDEPSSPPYTYGRLLRAIQIGQKLYQSGELVKHATEYQFFKDDTFSLLRDAFYAKWVDPILGCMGYFAAEHALSEKSTPSHAIDPGLPKEVAKNLQKYFSGLADTRIILASHFLPIAASYSTRCSIRRKSQFWLKAPMSWLSTPLKLAAVVLVS